MNCFQDIRLLSQSMSNTFCFHLSDQSAEELLFCKDPINNSCINLFFNQLILWYVIFNLIRIDKQYNVAINKVWEEVALKSLDKPETKNINIINDVNDNQCDTNRKDSMAAEFHIHENKENNELYASSSFSEKINIYYQKNLNREQKSNLKRLIYTIVQPPIVAIFCGFILGLIPLIKEWWFDTKTSVFVKNYFYQRCLKTL